jgi:molybdenum cofactor synthesis domain-containing protein
VFKAAILTVSDRGAMGQREDLSGETLKEMLQENGYQVVERKVVPDEVEEIRDAIRDWCQRGIHLVITTGGTGLSPRDRTPQAMDGLFDYEVPGMAEAIRAHGLKFTPHAMLSRGRAGVRGKTLIINLPGSKKGAMQGLEAVLPALEHGLSKLLGDNSDCGAP